MALAGVWMAGSFPVLAVERPAGLVVTFESGGATDATSWPGAHLHVAEGQSPSPFVPPGAFKAVWEGFVNSELRSEYTFHIEASGEVQLEMNGAPVAAGKAPAEAPGGLSLSSGVLKLGKGTNALRLTYRSPAKGDAYVRLYWSNAETPRNPVPVSALTHDESAALKGGALVREGRGLFMDLRCVRCHGAGEGAKAPELAMDAPSFAGIGSRLGASWMASWIADPASVRPGTPMPRMVHGPAAAGQAKAMAAFLAGLKEPAVAPGKEGDAEQGKALYEKLHCVSCHVAPEGGEADPSKVSQKGVKAKFRPGALAAFLMRPSEHFAWIRMPDFRLSAEEAANLAAYLTKHAEGEAPGEDAADAALRDEGRRLVETTGCLQCHALPGAKASGGAKALAQLPADKWSGGCMAETAVGGKVPAYALAPRQREALRAFAAGDRASLGRHVASEFVERQSASLRCAECHGKHEGFPTWELLGGKLRPEWAAGFIAGKPMPKPRPWLESRMPGFPAYASALAEGLATRHGRPARTPAEPPSVAADAEKGRKLVSANGGFSCVSCHGFADFGATAVFEAPGINLALSFERLQPDFYRRWLRSPLSIDPNTKMPVYFDEQGKSPLPEFFDGDGPRTIQGIWEYLKLGHAMPKPE
jgi:cytochrome c